jgi:hypothetical protein
LDKTDIEFTKIKDVKEIKNLYNLLVQPVKSDIFILYSNDFTNLSKLKIKSGINLSSSANFIDALSIKISSDFIKNDLKTNGNFENYLLLRYLSRIKEICADKKVKINLSII